jgi:hypothetical protein
MKALPEVIKIKNNIQAVPAPKTVLILITFIIYF